MNHLFLLLPRKRYTDTVVSNASLFSDLTEAKKRENVSANSADTFSPVTVIFAPGLDASIH
ncbi:hypothetical protein ABEQ41_31490 [Priestia megaterium]